MLATYIWLYIICITLKCHDLPPKWRVYLFKFLLRQFSQTWQASTDYLSNILTTLPCSHMCVCFIDGIHFIKKLEYTFLAMLVPAPHQRRAQVHLSWKVSMVMLEELSMAAPEPTYHPQQVRTEGSAMSQNQANHIKLQFR